MSKKGDKTTSMQIPPWLEASLKPYITDAVNKGQAMSDAAWAWGMANNPQGGLPNQPTGSPGAPGGGDLIGDGIIPDRILAGDPRMTNYNGGLTMGDLYGG